MNGIARYYLLVASALSITVLAVLAWMWICELIDKFLDFGEGEDEL